MAQTAAQGVAAPAAAEDVAAQVRALEERVAALHALIEDTGVAFGAIAVFVALITFFTIVKEVGSWLSSSETKALHNLSRETMTLVNAAMRYANEATARATRMAINAALNLLEKTDDDARKFLKRNASDLDVKQSPAVKTELDNLVSDINSFETNKLQFDQREDRKKLELTPHILFLLGLRDNYGQHYDGAVAAWEKGAEAAGDGDANNEIRAMNFYWAGVANNNMGKYLAAMRCFDNAKGALRTMASARGFEIRRIAIETSFFENWAKEVVVSRIVGDLERLVKDIENAGGEDLSRSQNRTRTTLGNVLLGGYFQHSKANWLDEAQHWFDEVVNATTERSIWAEFGRARALWAAGNRADAGAAFTAVAPLAQADYEKKSEPRGRLLAATTRYICACCTGDRREVERQQGAIEDLLGPIDPSSRVYSQFAVRNVDKGEFKKSVDDLYTTYLREFGAQ